MTRKSAYLSSAGLYSISRIFLDLLFRPYAEKCPFIPGTGVWIGPESLSALLRNQCPVWAGICTHGFLHWDIFAPANANSSIKELIDLYDDSNTFKFFDETGSNADNFFQMEEVVKIMDTLYFMQAYRISLLDLLKDEKSEPMKEEGRRSTDEVQERIRNLKQKGVSASFSIPYIINF